MAGNSNSGRDDIFTIIRNAYVKSDPSIPIYELGIDKKYLEILERWIFIDQLRSKDYPKKNTKEILHIYKRKYALSDKQFFNDKKNCERLFGGLVTINKEYEKRLAIEAYDGIFNIAIAKNDHKSAIEALKQKCLLLGLNEKGESDSLLNGEGNKTYVMTTNIILDNKIIEARKIDITDLQNMDMKQLKELSVAIDTPDADVEFMSDQIDKMNADG